MESKHTPGPWEIRYGNVADSDEGFGIASKIEPGFGIVAECWPCTTDLETRQTLRANARLIAAAPSLLAACQALLEASRKMRGEIVMSRSVSDATLREMFDADDKAQAAIAAAGGTNG